MLYICWYPRDILGTSCIFTLRETLAIGKNLDLVPYTGYFPSGSAVKTLPAMQEMRVRSLGLEDPLEREWQPTPVFLPGEAHGQRSLEGYRPEGCRASTLLK